MSENILDRLPLCVPTMEQNYFSRWLRCSHITMAARPGLLTPCILSYFHLILIFHQKPESDIFVKRD